MSSADQVLVVARALAQDRDLVGELDTIFTQAQALNIDFRGTARRRLQERVHQLLRNIDRERALLDGVDVHAAADGPRAGELAAGVERSLGRVEELVVSFGRTVELGGLLDLDHGPASVVLVAVAHALDDSLAAVAALAGVCAQPAEREASSGAPARRSPLWASRRVANFAVRLLPWEERQRYLDEYVSELDDLAQTENLSRRAQLWHALRLLARTPALRFALRATEPQAPQARSKAVSRLITAWTDA
ncbi:hypothetical protein ACIRSS_16985 [Amycolatopsis sp. NPDC101161]|uniref:hypothetical protein n=1 Tax=Amycolatopsis sp. NPDC101161 TaxID=3363940 RepID=UPI003817E7FD